MGRIVFEGSKVNLFFLFFFLFLFEDTNLLNSFYNTFLTTNLFKNLNNYDTKRWKYWLSLKLKA